MNLSERMKALTILADTVQGTIRAGWMDRVDLDELSDTWHSGEYKISWRDDGTAEVAGLRFRVEVTVSAVTSEPAKNEPLALAAAPCPWMHIPAGWFVRDPQGAWWEIVATERQGETVQYVTLRGSAGQRGAWCRGADQKVMACPGSARGPMQNALDALPPFEILDDRLEGF